MRQKYTRIQKIRNLDWLTVKQTILYTQLKQTHKIINTTKNNTMKTLMPLNTNGNRLQQQRKLDKKPSYLNKNKLTQSTLRNQCYKYNTLTAKLTSEIKHKKFKTELRKYIIEKQRQLI